MKWIRIVPVVMFAVCLQARPALAAANKEHLQLMAEIRMLQEQQQQLQGLLGALQDTLKVVTSKLDDQSAATRKAMADQTLATTNIGDNVRVLREKTDETNVRISTMSQELDALRQTIASQPSTPAAAPAPGATDPAAPAGAMPPGGTTPPPPPPASVIPPGTSPSRMYDTSYDDYTAGRFDLAIQGFQGFVQAFPRVPLAGTAVFNIGMSYYNWSRWAEARDAFLKVINEYPQAQGSVVPDSYYKLGQTYERLTQVDNAKKAYEAAVSKYPGTQTAALANQALQRINNRR
jgi:tol-pal system protein YbgF